MLDLALTTVRDCMVNRLSFEASNWETHPLAQHFMTLTVLIKSPNDANNQYCNLAAQACLNSIERASPIRTIHGR